MGSGFLVHSSWITVLGSRLTIYNLQFALLRSRFEVCRSELTSDGSQPSGGHWTVTNKLLDATVSDRSFDSHPAVTWQPLDGHLAGSQWLLATPWLRIMACSSSFMVHGLWLSACSGQCLPSIALLGAWVPQLHAPQVIPQVTLRRARGPPTRSPDSPPPLSWP